jgi:plasmid maintenance system antidote protein VapI
MSAADGQRRAGAAGNGAREHITRLRAAGGTYEAIAAAAGVAAMTVHAIANSDVQVTPATAAALLAVSPAELPHKRLDAGGTAWRLRSLMAMGHSGTRIAAAMDAHPQTVMRLVRGEAATVSAVLRQAAREVWEAWWDKVPPVRTAEESAAAGAARARARLADWPAPMGLDEERLDEPGYRPTQHWHPAKGAGVASDPPGRTGRARSEEAVSMTNDQRAGPASALEARAARSGAEAAQQVIAAQASAGVSTDRMASHHDDMAAWLWSEATTPEAERFAAAYAETADTLVAELREAGQPAPDRSPGAPHPDPVLGRRGWQACPHGDGVYVRRQAAAEAAADREAG